MSGLPYVQHTHGRAPNLPGARTIATPGQASKTTICSGFAMATSVRAGFGRCFDGEYEPPSSETVQSAPFRPPAGRAIDASNARNCPGPGEPLAWVRLMQAPKLECCSEHEHTPPAQQRPPAPPPCHLGRRCSPSATAALASLLQRCDLPNGPAAHYHASEYSSPVGCIALYHRAVCMQLPAGLSPLPHFTYYPSFGGAPTLPTYQPIRNVATCVRARPRRVVSWPPSIQFALRA
ncbi:hypothetical protein E2P81_ATG10157 [Venturia nashicola]|nr:hypothetical protein E2P81_ATG10157 [Venturia nashicola]